jgi:hypothetical protein
MPHRIANNINRRKHTAEAQLDGINFDRHLGEQVGYGNRSGKGSGSVCGLEVIVGDRYDDAGECEGR